MSLPKVYTNVKILFRECKAIMTMPPAKWLLSRAALLLITAFTIVFAFHPIMAEDPLPRKYKKCNFHRAACTASLPQTTVTLDILPKPVKTMRPLTFVLNISGRQPASLPYIDLGMPGMDMGPNRVSMKGTGRGQYRGRESSCVVPAARGSGAPRSHCPVWALRNSFLMSSIDTILLLFLATGFTVGFGHCIGMCGPIVVSLSLAQGKRGIMAPHLLYHAGRITTYTFLGGIVGLTGSFTSVAAAMAGLQKGVLIFSGILIIAMAVAMTGWIPAGKIFGDGYDPRGIVAKGFKRLSTPRRALRYYPLGMVLGLLPCGPVYTALLAAGRAGMEADGPTGAVLRGICLMLAFGLGTVPALFLVARLSDFRWLKSRDRVYQFGSVLMLGAGVYFVIRGIRY